MGVGPNVNGSIMNYPTKFGFVQVCAHREKWVIDGKMFILVWGELLLQSRSWRSIMIAISNVKRSIEFGNTHFDWRFPNFTRGLTCYKCLGRGPASERTKEINIDRGKER